MKRLWMKLSLLVLLNGSILFAAPLKVVTTVTDLAYVTSQIGKENVSVSSLLDGTENPHYIDAIPEFIQRVSQADAVIIVGLELEVGWMPKVLARSGKSQVQPGGNAYLEVGKAINVLDKPTGPVNRSMGDVHPGGNPHFWLSPDGLIQAAGPVTDLLINLQPAKAEEYLKNKEAFTAKMKALGEKNQKKLAELGLSGNWLMEYHKEFSYLLKQYNLTSFGSVEEKPGVAPSAGRLAQVGIAAKNADVRVVLAAEYTPKKTLERFTEISGIPVVIVPTSLQPDGRYSDFESLHDHVVDAIVGAVKKRSVGE